MEKETVALICLTALGVGTVIGIFVTKIPGWGRFSSSTLILILVLFITAEMLVLGKVEAQPSTNLFFAIVGYAGGLIASKKADEEGKPEPH